MSLASFLAPRLMASARRSRSLLAAAAMQQPPASSPSSSSAAAASLISPSSSSAAAANSCFPQRCFASLSCSTSSSSAPTLQWNAHSRERQRQSQPVGGVSRGYASSSSSSSSSSSDDDDDRGGDADAEDDNAEDEPSTSEVVPSLPPGASRAEELLHEIETSPRARARYLLTRVMDGKEADALGPLPSADAAQAAADAEALARWASQLRSQVVDVNRSSKGSPTGGVARFSAMVVSGNAAGVLGLGVGRGAEVSDAVRKATRAAVAAAARSGGGGGIGGGGGASGSGGGGGGGGGGGLFFVPRAARASPLARSEAWFGGVKATVFPLPTGRGLKASPLAAGICRLAGLTDAGVKFHGSRTRRHMVKALVRALEQGPTLADSTRRAAAAVAAASAASGEAAAGLSSSSSPSPLTLSATARELAALRKGGGQKKKKKKSSKGQLQRIAGVSGEWYRR